MRRQFSEAVSAFRKFTMPARSLQTFALTAICLGLIAIGFLGCSSERRSQLASAPNDMAAYESYTNDTEGEFGVLYSANDIKREAKAGMVGGIAENTNPAKPGEVSDEKTSSTPSANNRKIIYKSQLRINVENFDGIDKKLNQLINQTGGFVSNAKVDHMQGRQRSGHWQIRIPVAKYQSFMSSAGDIGTVVSRNEDANDVTAEFYDLEARIKNKQRLEERIAALLDEAKGELKRLIEVEKELARVREEIERMEGHKRFLSDVTALTTIDIYVTEVKNFVPEQTASFSDRVSNAWTSAVTQSTETAQNLIVGLVRNALNIASIVFLAIVAWLAYRIFFKGRRNAAN